MAEKTKQSVNYLTSGSISKNIVRFFLPIVVGSFLQQLYNTADAIIVGKFVGKAALSAVGGTTGVIVNLILGFFIGLSSGATVIISQYYGAEDHENLERAVHSTIALCLAGGTVIAAIGTLSAPLMLKLVNTPADVLAYALPYLRIYFLGTGGILFYIIGSGVLRAVGDSKGPLRVLLFCTVLNVGLDLLFVAGFRMETTGAALATILSQLFSAILVVRMIHRRGGAFRIRVRKIRFHGDLTRRICYIGLPAGAQSIMYALSNLIIQTAVNGFGTDSIASWTVYGKIDAIFWMVMDAFGVAVTTFIAQNYGAGNLGRVKKGVNVCFKLCFGIAISLSAALYFLGGYLNVLFTDDAYVLQRSVEILHHMVPFFFTWVCIQVLANSLRAMGDSLVPMLLIAFGVCGLRVVWVLFVAPLLPHILEYTVCCYQISWAFTSILFLIYYYKLAPIRKVLRGVTPSEI